MSYMRYVEHLIDCDGERCRQRLSFQNVDKKSAIIGAKNQGWIFKGKKAFCRFCAKK